MDTDASWFIIMPKDVHTHTQTGSHYINSPYPAHKTDLGWVNKKKNKKEEAMRRNVSMILQGFNHQNRKREGKARSSKPETVLRPWGQLAINSGRFFIQEGSAVVLSLTLVLPLPLTSPLFFCYSCTLCSTNKGGKHRLCKYTLSLEIKRRFPISAAFINGRYHYPLLHAEAERIIEDKLKGLITQNFPHAALCKPIGCPF